MESIKQNQKTTAAAHSQVLKPLRKVEKEPFELQNSNLAVEEAVNHSAHAAYRLPRLRTAAGSLLSQLSGCSLGFPTLVSNPKSPPEPTLTLRRSFFCNDFMLCLQRSPWCKSSQAFRCSSRLLCFLAEPHRCPQFNTSLLSRVSSSALSKSTLSPSVLA